MRCHSCGVEVREGQRFCMDCGASLRGVADVTGEVPIVRPATETTEPATESSPPAAGELAAVTPAVTAPVAALPPPPPVALTTTSEVVVVEATSPPVDVTAPMAAIGPVTGVLAPTDPAPGSPAPGGFRLRPMLIVALLAAAATVLAVFGDVAHITPPPDGAVPQYTVNGLGTNNTVAALLAAGGAVVGALVWCAGRRWGAGFAGGAGASLAGWAALLVGLTEWRISSAAPGAAIERNVGYYALWAAGVVGVVLLVMSVARVGRAGRSGLDPWIAALAAASFLIAAAGPLIPEGTADWSGNWSNASLGGVTLPDAFFVGRLVQLGLLVVCGVVGCLLVRRWGLGLAIGGLLSSGWLLLTAATDRTPSPIGPAYANPGAGRDLSPHAVTVVGFALAAFFALVAVVLAIIDAER